MMRHEIRRPRSRLPGARRRTRAVIVAGGVAVNAHGYQRVTQDLDLVLSLDPRKCSQP